MAKYNPVPGSGCPGFDALALTSCIRSSYSACVRRTGGISACKAQRKRLGFELGNAILAQIVGDGAGGCA